MFQLTLVAVGLGAVVAKSILAFTIIKFVGVGYLLYLAVRQWRASSRDLREKMSGPPTTAGLPLLARGFLVNATNPKALVFYLAVLPQFVSPTAPLPAQYLVIGLTFITVDIVVMSLYAGLATRLLRLLGARQQVLLNRFFSGLFATAAMVLARGASGRDCLACGSQPPVGPSSRGGQQRQQDASHRQHGDRVDDGREFGSRDEQAREDQQRDNRADHDQQPAHPPAQQQRDQAADEGGRGHRREKADGHTEQPI